MSESIRNGEGNFQADLVDTERENSLETGILMATQKLEDALNNPNLQDIAGTSEKIIDAISDLEDIAYGTNRELIRHLLHAVVSYFQSMPGIYNFTGNEYENITLQTLETAISTFQEEVNMIKKHVLTKI